MDALTRCTSAVVGGSSRSSKSRRPNSLSSSSLTSTSNAASSSRYQKLPTSSSTGQGLMAAASNFFHDSFGGGGASTSTSKSSGEAAATSGGGGGDLEEFGGGGKYHYDLDFDMDCLRRALLEQGRELDESGYQSVLQRSQHSQYGTGWMMLDTASIASTESTDEWDGYMSLGGEKVKIKELSDLLATRYAFLSGAKTPEGLPILTFPDSRIHLPFPDYRRLVTYLLQVPPLEDSYHGYVIVVDRRSDKWTALKSLLIHIANYFPANLRVVYLLKPEGVLQRALEVGYKSIVDSCHFHIVLCHSAQELHARVSVRCLTLDLGGSLKYNHLEWVQHRMDIERMRASTQVIAHSLEEFSRCLKETELPNDAETTQHILETQRTEREAIKEDFHIAVRRGLALLKSVRQAEAKPCADQLSPTRLHNVTSIERMLIQLDETEKSFEKFWTQHERRLQRCLELRRFEDDFRKLQTNFASHMLHLEEHREVGDSVSRVDTLIDEHVEYMNSAKEDTAAAENLKRRGEELILVQEKELEGSLRPKCQELERMAEALKSALRRRLDVLHMSKQMHEQISVANAWCAKGVELLTKQQMEMFTRDESKQALLELDDFLTIGTQLHCQETNGGVSSSIESIAPSTSTTSASSTLALAVNGGGNGSPDLKTLVLMTTTDTRTLLQQVTARITDIKKMCESRRTYLEQTSTTTKTTTNSTIRTTTSGSPTSKSKKPIGAVSPDGHKVIVDYESPNACTSSSPALSHEETVAVAACTSTSGGSVTIVPVGREAANNSPSKSPLKLSPQGSFDFPIAQSCTTSTTSSSISTSQLLQKTPTPARAKPNSYQLTKNIDRKLSLPTLSDIPSPRSPSAISLLSNHSISVDSSSSTSTVAVPPTSPSSKAVYVINELITTEETYVNELRSIIDSYLKAFDNPALKQLLPENLKGKQTTIFGNLCDIWHFHSQIFLKDLLLARGRADRVAKCFLERRAHLYLYNVYCQNKPKSEELRQEIGETHPFFQECQRMAGHRLPLGAYLLKPVQRITKYQLILKELSKHCADKEYKSEIDQAVECVLELLQQLNASMHQSHISGYPGDLASLGQLLLQGKFSVWSNRKHGDKSSLRLRRTSKVQQRHLFLYTKAIVFCKHRVLQPNQYAQDYYEFKLLMPVHSVSLSEYVKGNPLKFELSVDNRQETHIFLPQDQRTRTEWLTRLKQLILDNFHSARREDEIEAAETAARLRLERPVSWTSQTSSDSSRSSRDLSSNPDIVERITPPGDTNNNPPSPRSLPEAEVIPTNEYVSTGGDFSDSENNTIVQSDNTRLIA